MRNSDFSVARSRVLVISPERFIEMSVAAGFDVEDARRYCDQVSELCITPESCQRPSFRMERAGRKSQQEIDKHLVPGALGTFAEDPKEPAIRVP